jgi:hypothetical protein
MRHNSYETKQLREEAVGTAVKRLRKSAIIFSQVSKPLVKFQTEYLASYFGANFHYHGI